MGAKQMNEEQLKDAFCEVRKAHRLIYEYQRRMQDLTWFIKNKLGFPKYEGYKKFSQPVSSRNKIYHDNWSWDFIYTYVFEYSLGTQEDKEKHISWALSLIQVSDTGFYINQTTGSSKTNISSYAPPEESESRLLFYLSAAPETEQRDWAPDPIINNYAASSEFDKEEFSKIVNTQKPGCVQIVYSVPLSRFIDATNTTQILRDFVRYCNDNAGTSLSLQE